MSKNTIFLLVIILIAITGLISFWLVNPSSLNEGEIEINSFSECMEAGYPIMESYPRQCQGPEGQVFVEEINIEDNVSTTTPSEGDSPIARDGCIISGCSNQVCAEESVITTCEAKPEYKCYDFSRCEKNQAGKCAWVETPQYKSCRADLNLD